MKTANNLIILYEDGTFWAEAETDSWIEYWNSLWPSGKSELVPLAFGESSEIPLNLYKFPVVRVANLSVKQVAREISGRLVSPANPVS